MTGNYDIDGVSFEFVSSNRDLDIVIGSKFKFHEHVRDVVKKSGGMAGKLMGSTVHRSPSFNVSLFVSHIKPIMDFSSCV